MNLKETHHLLIFISQYDNRRIDDAVVIAWHAIVANLDQADARQAVIRHFSTQDAYLMPVHVVRGVEAIDRERREAITHAREVEVAALEATDPGRRRRDRSDAVETLIAELRAKLPEGHPDFLRHAAGYWRQVREARERQEAAMPNTHYDPLAAAHAVQAMTSGES